MVAALSGVLVISRSKRQQRDTNEKSPGRPVPGPWPGRSTRPGRQLSGWNLTRCPRRLGGYSPAACQPRRDRPWQHRGKSSVPTAAATASMPAPAWT